MATVSYQVQRILLQKKLQHKTTLNLWAASETAKSNGRPIDQGVSGYWLYHVETCRETVVSQEQNDKTGVFRWPAQRNQQALQEEERKLGPPQGQPHFIHHMALPCSCCRPKKLHQAHAHRPTNHPNVPDHMISFSTPFPKELSRNLKTKSIAKK